MAATATAPVRFVRRTRLDANEYRKNFHQIDADIISAVTSADADRITPLMSKIYLRLASAPAEFWEGDGALYFRAKNIDGRPVKASKVLYEVLGVASATAHKALSWMHEQGIIGYFSGKNGVGIRIFLNRAAGSIGVRATVVASKKILPFVHGSQATGAGSTVEPAFNDPFGNKDILDKDLNRHAPKTGADQKALAQNSSDQQTDSTSIPQANTTHRSGESTPPGNSLPGEFSLDEIISQLRRALEPELAMAATQAAAREHERTRQWLDHHGIPKATRVAQREAYNVLRSHGVVVTGKEERLRAALEVGRAASDSFAPAALPHPLTAQEIQDTAETCLALLETQGKSIEATLSEISAEGGGWLLPEDIPRVREAATRLLLDVQVERRSNDAFSC